MSESDRGEFDELLAPLRRLIEEDRDALMGLTESYGFAPQPGSVAADDRFDVRFLDQNDESLFSAGVIRVGKRLIVIDNVLDGLVRLMHGHAPVFSPQPLLRVILVAAARARTFIAPAAAEERAAAIVLDWIHALTERARTIRALGADAPELLEAAKAAEARQQHIAGVHGFTMLGRGRKVRWEKGPAKPPVFEYVGDGEAIKRLLQPRAVDLTRPDDVGMGPYMWAHLSDLVHVDSLALFESLDIQKTVDPEDPRIETTIATQLNTQRLGALVVAAHWGIGYLVADLGRHWGWAVEEWGAAHLERGRPLANAIVQRDEG